MKKIIIVSCLLLSTVKLFGQQYTQYNTGTLYDSFENPSQRSFIPDSSRSAASNFFLPNFNANFIVTGNAQDAVLDRFFNGYYNTAALQVGKGKYSNIRSSTNNYWLMLKLFTSLDGNQEIGMSLSTRTEARGYVTDESIALFNGYSNFDKLAYSNVFNDNYLYQAYHQLSFSYREQVNKRLALGLKLSFLTGLTYGKVNINKSGVVFDPPNDAATLSMSGTVRMADSLKLFNFRNPGVAISIGAGHTNRAGYHFQYNLKDLGVIRWADNAKTADFENNGRLIQDISSAQREDNIINAIQGITSGTLSDQKYFYTKTNALAEVSVNKNYWLDYAKKFKLSPTLLASKALFYEDATLAAIVPVSYSNYSLTGTAAYNTLGLFNFGAQLMYKTPNAEIYLGTERLLQSVRGVLVATGNNTEHEQVQRSHYSHSGADIYLGVSFKFGNVIEHPMNASFIPDGEKGFLGKMWDKIFKGKDKNY
ncbi:DUF5723 family protein [Mucilaginibacter calamicampi]|uniref:DUF5723 family protein n=1 Tax=Mucilaginibacter calamicampi TaxID=1302352 RepID=A0ABW2YZD8_9SPHI